MDSLTWPKALDVNRGILSEKEIELAEKFLCMGQHHLFEMWEPPGLNDAAKHSFFEQAEKLDDTPGGIDSYVKRAKVLLASAKAGENPFEGWTPEVPSGASLVPLTAEYEGFEQDGILELGNCGFVLVAGGLGERLGYNGIKIELPSQTVTRTSYLELYCQQILAVQTRYAKPGQLIPLAIMVSDDTEAKTRDLLERNNYFGMKRSQITLMKQGKVPALLDDQAHIAMNGLYEINAKPHGHGDVHSLMHSTGTAQAWSAANIRWVVFFQDTNGLAFHALPAMLGVSVQLRLEVNSMSIERVAKQSIGAIAKLKHNDGREMTVNVEYNQLDPLLRATYCPDGDVNDPKTGCSPFPGNINQLLFQMEPYLRTLHASNGIMPEFVNPKYADSARTTFKKPTRLECMMQDYPRLLSPTSKVGFTTAPAWLCYSPCKNNPVDAAASLASGVPASAPYTAECDQYHVFAHMLRTLGAKIDFAPEESILGITATPSPRLVFHPSFLLFPHEIRERFPTPENVRISAHSTLIIEGDVIVHNLDLEGSLSLHAVPNTRILVKPTEKVENAGHRMVLLTEGGIAASDLREHKSGADGKLNHGFENQLLNIDEADAMRGYILVKKETLEECTAKCFSLSICSESGSGSVEGDAAKGGAKPGSGTGLGSREVGGGGGGGGFGGVNAAESNMKVEAEVAREAVQVGDIRIDGGGFTTPGEEVAVDSGADVDGDIGLATNTNREGVATGNGDKRRRVGSLTRKDFVFSGPRNHLIEAAAYECMSPEKADSENNINLGAGTASSYPGSILAKCKCIQ